MQLVSFLTPDRIKLKGILCRASSSSITVIHVHGSCGNFYENDFIEFMTEYYPQNGLNFLSFNNRGHDCVAEAYQDGSLIYLGGALENFDDCDNDVLAAVQFVERFSNRVILQGHSLGCLKVLSYALRHKSKHDIVLLSPSDAHQLQLNFRAPETIQQQVERIAEVQNTGIFDLLPSNEFGISNRDCYYCIPISRTSLLKLLASPYLELLRYRSTPMYMVDSRVFVYYGERDPLWTVSKDDLEKFYRERTRSLRLFALSDGDHHFHGYERQVLYSIVDWIGNEV